MLDFTLAMYGSINFLLAPSDISNINTVCIYIAIIEVLFYAKRYAVLQKKSCD